MDSQQVFQIAREAVERLVAERGAEATFPFDAIWEYATADVPSLQRPAQAKRLVSAGYLEETGRVTRASSGPRAGSPTTEYRPGSRFRPPPAPGRAPRGEPAGSTSDAIKAMEAAMAARGFITKPDQLANFYLALKTSPLVILAGITGVGKSWLPRLFAELVGADFTAVPVEPQWSDNADLLGYCPTLSPDTFVPGKLTGALLNAFQKPDRPAIVLLDEMNLAPVEHYFSDFLSVIETRRREGGQVITDRLPLDLPQAIENTVDRFAELRKLYIPPNLRVVGSVNMDETTRAFSPKVLDRAFSIEFSDVDLTAFVPDSSTAVDPKRFSALANGLMDPSNPVSVTEVYAKSEESKALFDWVAGQLQEINAILERAGLSFGYRTRDVICLYMWHWRRDDLSDVLPAETALDLCILQKILPRVSGTGEALRRSLEELKKWLERDDPAISSSAISAARAADRSDGEAAEGDAEPVVNARAPAGISVVCTKRPYLRSAEKVARMLQRLTDEGATVYWGT